MIELRLLRYFVAVAETEHVGRAAVRLHVSQSPLSRQIRRLEALLDLRLFSRARRGIQLTDAGRWLLGPARAILERADGLAAEARQALSGAARLAVGFVGTALSSGALPAALRELRARHPSVRVALRHLNSAQQLVLLASGELDLALVHGRPSGTAFQARRVFEQPYALVVPRQSPLARRPLRPSLIAAEPFIAVRSSNEERARWLGRLEGARISVEVADWSSAIALVDAGMGIALVPMSQRATAAPTVCFRPVPWLALKSELWVVQRAATTPLIEELADEVLRQHVQKRDRVRKWKR